MRWLKILVYPKGQMEAFKEHLPANKNNYPQKYIKWIELEGGRKIKAENTPLNVHETRNCGYSMPPISDYDFSFCAWRRAVLALKEHHHAWVRYCYGNDLYYSHQITICQYIWEMYRVNLVGAKLQRRRVKKIIALMWLAAQDVAEKNKDSSYTEYAAATLAGLIEIHRDTWYDSYAHRWMILKEIAKELDRASLVTLLHLM